MKNSIKIEEFCMLGLGIFMFSILGYSWWLFLVLFLTPDIGMLGYLVNSKIGAITYNLLHHKGIAILLYFIGIYFELPLWQLAGTILFSHAAFDRMLGYGLKYEDGFKFTHLGKIGKGE
ncbi:DUF4260 domain-containing protein [uncultured Maribacter sp.]|uniref:DUF4260 domain-containing protein n=1 Tax=uncultured Maribacter sp. TaxID=431308 RepID=UPI00260C5C69|nr:DUF4260 domain-containing protein [uncultured Maribacter sp.]